MINGYGTNLAFEAILVLDWLNMIHYDLDLTSIKLLKIFDQLISEKFGIVICVAKPQFFLRSC